MTTTQYPAITLQQDKEVSVLRFHPWIFSGAIKSETSKISNGQIVDIYSSKEKYLATGHYSDKSIAVKILSFEKKNIDQSFWDDKVKNAYELRSLLGLINNKHSNAFRLVNAEGDNLPGLIIDIYGETAVIHAHTVGMKNAKKEIANALKKEFTNSLTCIYFKNLSSSNNTVSGEYLLGNNSSNLIIENEHSFYVDWEQGQKTGFYIDQCENRKLFAQFVKNKTVLNAFCYSGGFSVYALKAGASLVDSVDSSEKAISWVDKNIELNRPFTGKHNSYADDVMNYLQNTKQNYDVIVIDPPAFAKHKSARHNAIQGYKRLAVAAIARLNKNGVLFTFSCSQLIDKVIFEKTTFAAAIESGKKIQLLHRLSQPPDHPVNVFHPEGEYLKGLVLMVQ